MMVLTVDAGVIAVPEADSTPNNAYKYVEALLEWRKLLEEPWLAIHLSEYACEALISDGLYPFRKHLQALFAATGVSEYDPNTVAQAAESLLKLTPSFEAYFRVRDVLADSVEMEPELVQLTGSPELQSDLARCLILVALLRAHCRTPIGDHSFVVKNAPGPRVTLRAIVHDIEHERDDISGVPKAPEVFTGDVLICDDFGGLVDSLDEASLLLGASDSVGIRTAVRVAYFKYRRGCSDNADWDACPQFVVGDRFLASCEAAHLRSDTAKKVLRAAVETLDQRAMSATHWLRSGAGPKDPQRVRSGDGAKAWRRDVDRDHHLHYWSCDSNVVEFAWLGFPHDDFTIPE